MNLSTTLNFCTMFNSRYILQGLALYQSLEKNCSNFHLYIVAFDDLCADILSLLQYKNLTVIKLEDFESERLKSIKHTRSCGEYFWTSTPYLILYCIEQFKLIDCTYLDADIYFYSNPFQLISEIPQEKSVLITEHRFTKKYDQTETSGKYCVQFMTFKNNTDGLNVLNWWYDRCIEWCFNRHEDGKFGDQKYLDQWTKMFNGIHELQHLGGGVAPWNVQQYSIFKDHQQVKLKNKTSQEPVPIVFYHFHSFRFLMSKLVDLGSYELDKTVKDNIYAPYIKHLTELHHELVSFKNYSLVYPPFKSNLIQELKKVYWHRKNIIYLKNILASCQ